MSDYLDRLKSTELRPGKVKITKNEQVLLNEQANDGKMDLLVKIL